MITTLHQLFLFQAIKGHTMAHRGLFLCIVLYCAQAVAQTAIPTHVDPTFPPCFPAGVCTPSPTPIPTVRDTITVGGKVWHVERGGEVTVNGRSLPVVCCPTGVIVTDGTHVVVESEEFGFVFTTIYDVETERSGPLVIGRCMGDFNGNGFVTVDEILMSVTNAVDSCGLRRAP